ncbi:MAG: hypothetical protein JSW39_15930 [Desulfobacterales bacterium]|nr:MAG: hypothetical protein JSW39_15930 [Desulfobacterales bacterium]
MTFRHRCPLLAEKIHEILRAGIYLSDGVLQYIDSTFSNPSKEELQGIFQDESNCEKDALIELILFPEESMQLQLEDLLESFPFQKQDEPRVLDCLGQPPFQTTIHFPDTGEPVVLVISRPVLAQFVARLNIAWQLDRRLAAAISASVGVKDQARVKVKLRNAKLSAGDDAIRFLCDLVAKLATDRHRLFVCLDFVCSFLNELKEGADIFQTLMAQKKFYFQSLQKAKKLALQLRRSNMETLLLQGVKIPLIDMADARRKMAMIDGISHAVFGRTEYFDPVQMGEGLETSSQNPDIGKIIRYLI